MEPVKRVELLACGLRNRCSTTELHRPGADIRYQLVRFLGPQFVPPAKLSTQLSCRAIPSISSVILASLHWYLTQCAGFSKQVLGRRCPVGSP